MTGQSWIATNRIITGDVLRYLSRIEPGSIQTVVTSPPYWGMRRYDPPSAQPKWSDGTSVDLGGEARPEEYIAHTRDVLQALHRVLRVDGTVWWNIADTYFTRAVVRKSSKEKLDALEGRLNGKWKDAEVKRTSSGHEYLADKDLTLIPFRVAMAAQQLDFWVRSIVIWSKENAVPEREYDRPAIGHEYILMLTKAERYLWNAHEARELASGNGKGASDNPWSGLRRKSLLVEQSPMFLAPEAPESEVATDGLSNNSRPEMPPDGPEQQDARRTKDGQVRTRLLRSVWRMPSVTSGKGHPAAFPQELAARCIRLSSNPGDIVLDPFMGSGTTALAADQLGRRFIGIDIVERYAQLASARVQAAREQRESLWSTDAEHNDGPQNEGADGASEQETSAGIGVDTRVAGDIGS